MGRNMENEHNVPRYTIDLSDEPQNRYVALAFDYKEQINKLTSLFDGLLADLGIPKVLHPSVNRVARLILRRVHSSTENQEIRGIAKVAAVPMYLLVAFNVVLDLLMGCTSGAVRSLESDQSLTEAKMLHFRTLDWGMDPLRAVIVQLDFVKSKSPSAQKVLASSITYAGFVGVLTGVRQDLSLSLNFRGLHNARNKRQHFRFYLHHLLVFLGIRPSIASLLRNYLFDGSGKRGFEPLKSLASLLKEVPSIHSTAAYLIFSDGSSSVTIEKDYTTAVVRQSQSFIAITNHDLDVDEDIVPGATVNEKQRTAAAKLSAMEGFLEESADRRDCLVKKWQSKVRRERRRRQKVPDTCGAGSNLLSVSTGTTVLTRSVARLSSRQGEDIVEREEISIQDAEHSVAISQNEVVDWVSAWPTTNECTHYAAVLDPRAGKVAWVRRYTQAVEELDG